MPNWRDVIEEVQREAQKGTANAFDVVRRKYISLLFAKTNRNVIAYYSGWLQKPNSSDVIVNDKDKNAFMANVP